MKHFFTIVIIFLVVTLTIRAQGWRKLSLPEIDNTSRIIQFVDSSNGFVFAETQLFNTTDGGISWKAYSYPSQEKFVIAKFFDDTLGYLVGAKNYYRSDVTIFRTTNRGKEWSMSFSFNNDIVVLGISIVENMRMFILGGDFKYYRKYCWKLDLSNSQRNLSIEMGQKFSLINSL